MKTTNLMIALLAVPLVACGSPEGKSKSVSSKNEAYQNDWDTEEPADSNNNGTTGSNNGITSTNNGTSGTNNDAPNNGTTGTNNDLPDAICGDDILDAGEQCDGSVDTTCEALGFDGGSIGCSDSCEVDTSNCFHATCGDGVVQAAEICDDGADNGSYDACNGNCSGAGPHCGDAVLNGAEQCDTSDFGGVTCQALGFDGGTLGCDAACGYDTSGCSTCGDGVVGAGEICDDGSLNGTYGNCNALCTGIGAFCGDGVRNGNEACDGADLGGQTCGGLGHGSGAPTCTSSCEFDTATCSLIPNAGEIVITEIMQNPAIDLDNDGEYFELWNATNEPRNLGGCTIESSTASGPESFTIATDLQIPAGGYAVFARNSNAPFVADYVYNGAINLNNSVDELAVICTEGGTPREIDRVSYDDGATFPDPDGASMSLSPTRLTASQNDAGANWCESTSAFGNGDLGTPGAPNDGCP